VEEKVFAIIQFALSDYNTESIWWASPQTRGNHPPCSSANQRSATFTRQYLFGVWS